MSAPRIAVVGAGLIGARHARLVARDAVLAAVVDPDPRAVALARELGAPHLQTLDACLAGQRPDGVIVATPNQLHADHAGRCVDAGVPVLIEKPITETARSAAALCARAEAAGVPLLVGHHRRHNPLIDAARAAIDAGRIGRLVTVDAQCWLMKPDDYFEADWRRRRGAGPVFINLIHDIDLLRHLCGEICRVRAVESAAVRGHEVEDTAALLLEFEGGALGTVSVTDTAVAPWSWELTAGENPAYPQVPAACYRLGGTHGALSVPDLRLWINPGPRGWWEPLEARVLPRATGDPLTRQLAHFIRVIRGQDSPLVDGRAGLAALRVVEAIKTAAATGQAQEL